MLARSLDDADRRQALTAICVSYWYPLYVYARRRGLSEHDAKDFVQLIFLKMLETNFAARADPEKGKLRELLVTVANRLLGDEQDKRKALKRGGGALLQIDMEDAERQLVNASYESQNPEVEFDREWARRIVDLACRALDAKYTAAGKSAFFAVMRQYLPGTQDPSPHTETAA